jgi:hypothetical protein
MYEHSWQRKDISNVEINHIKSGFKTFGSEKFCWTARLGFKRYILSYSFCSSKQIRHKISNQKREKCHAGWGGGSKGPKSAMYYLNGPIDYKSQGNNFYQQKQGRQTLLCNSRELRPQQIVKKKKFESIRKSSHFKNLFLLPIVKSYNLQLNCRAYWWPYLRLACLILFDRILNFYFYHFVIFEHFNSATTNHIYFALYVNYL